MEWTESALTDDVSLDRLGLVTLGALNLQATYTGPLDEDARILLALEHPDLVLPAPETPRLLTVLTAVLQAGVVEDWRAALGAYAAQRGIAYDERANRLGELTIELDELGRVATIGTR